jgi:hypothetical protein
MALKERLALYEQIEGHRGCPLLVYVTSKRDGIDAFMASDALPYFIDQLDRLPPKTSNLDLLIVSLGGDPMVAWRMMSLMRQRVDKVSVLIPQSAYSAATLLALGADEIVMHPNGHLGPIDMQVTTFADGRRRQFSTEDIGAFLEFVKDNLSITDQRHLRRLFEITCKEMGTTGVGFTARTSKLAMTLADRLLGLHIKEDETGSKRKVMVERLSKHFYGHGYPVSRKEALEITTSVKKEPDPVLEPLMWSVWLDLEEELKERQPFDAIFELCNSPEGAKLLAPVPQLDLPANVPAPSWNTLPLADIVGEAEEIQPVNFEHVLAIMESRQLASRSIEKGKILASRLPDLNLQVNPIVTFRGWEKTHP